MRTSEGEAGLIASQLAVVMPALLLLIMLAVQFGLWAHATQIARAAADAAASTAALSDASLEDAQAVATSLLTQAGNLTDPTVTVDRDDTQVAVVATGTAPQLVPGLRFAVSAESAAPRELFIPQDNR